MEMKPLSPNHKCVLTHSDTLPPRMEMGDSSNIGYGHSQEISSQTGSGPDMDRFLTDDLENNKDTLERSYPKVIRQEEDVYSTAPNFAACPQNSNSLSDDSEYLHNMYNPPWRRDSSFAGNYHRRPVSPPLRRRFQGAPSISDIVPRSNSWREDGIGPQSLGDQRMDDFQNDNNFNREDLSSPKNPNEETSSKKKDEVNYTRASNVTVSNFVSVKLSGKSNYDMWKAQMECLMKSHKMRGLVIKDRELPVNKNNELIERYEILLNGWLIGSLSEEIIKDNRIYGKGAKGIWDTLEQSYDSYAISPTESALLLPRDKKEKQGTDIDPRLKKKLQNATLEGHWWKAKSPTDSTPLEVRKKIETTGTTNNSKLKKKLHTAALEGDWWKAKSILDIHKEHNGAATWVISDNNDTLLHVAAREGNNYFLNKLLNIIDNGEQIKKANLKGHTALHIAAIVGNKEAAELLVEKRKDLLEIKDDKSKIPLACAYLNKQVNAFVYLWKVTHDVREVTQRSIDESLPPKKSEKDTKIEVDECLKIFGTEIFNILEEKEKKKQEKEQKEKEKEKEMVNGKSQQDKEKEKQEKEQKEKEKKKEKEMVNGKSLQDKEKEKQKEKEKKEKQEKEKKEKQEKEKQKEKEKKEKEKEKKEEFIGKIGESFLHTAIFNKEYDLAKELVKINPGLANEPITLVDLTQNFPSQIGFTETLIYPSLNNVCQRLLKRSSLLLHSLEYLYARAGGTLWKMRSFKNKNYCSLFPELVISLLVPAVVLYPIYQLLCLLILLLLFPFSMLYFILWKALAFLVVPIKNIEKKIKEHKEAKKFLKFICNSNKSWEANSSDEHFDQFYKDSLMEAVRLDVYEVIDQILKLSSNAMKVKNKDGHNIIQLAVINRSTKVYNLLTPIIEGKGSYRRAKDVFNNNLLHLAGRLAPLAVLSCTSGAALQLQRELQWREEVKKLMEPTQHTDLNVDYETPAVVFSREHANLVKEGEKWMKTTAESCSITAALIITIVFAAAITVPGGSNQETGIPLFKKEIAFNIFAVADAISLFSASTSLLVFLSILTTRFAEKDFLISLPRRLFVGLCLLFLSTTAMMLAFSTILFLVFCDKRPWMLAPIGGLTCFPIAAIVTLQLPLVIDLYQATSIPIFGKEEKVEKVQKSREAEDKKEKRKFRNILRNINPILKRRIDYCLPVCRGNL